MHLQSLHQPLKVLINFKVLNSLINFNIISLILEFFCDRFFCLEFTICDRFQTVYDIKRTINFSVSYNDLLRSYVRNVEYTEKYRVVCQCQRETGVLSAFRSSRLLYHDNVFIPPFFRMFENFILYISRGHSNSRSRCNRMSYFLTCLSFPPPSYPLNVDKFAMPAREG